MFTFILSGYVVKKKRVIQEFEPSSIHPHLQNFDKTLQQFNKNLHESAVTGGSSIYRIP